MFLDVCVFATFERQGYSVDVDAQTKIEALRFVRRNVSFHVQTHTPLSF